MTEQDEYLKNLLDNAPLYNGQTNLNEIDDIIKYYRKAQKAKARLDATTDQLYKTEQTILMIMKHFNIPSRTRLVGEIIEEILFEIWADETDRLHVRKTKDLAPSVDEGNIITIKIRNSRHDPDDD